MHSSLYFGASGAETLYSCRARSLGFLGGKKIHHPFWAHHHIIVNPRLQLLTAHNQHQCRCHDARAQLPGTCPKKDRHTERWCYGRASTPNCRRFSTNLATTYQNSIHRFREPIFFNESQRLKDSMKVHAFIVELLKDEWQNASR